MKQQNIPVRTMLELKRKFNCSIDFKKPFLHLKFSLNLSGFTLQYRRSFGSLYKGAFAWENSHRREFHIRMTFRFLITISYRSEIVAPVQQPGLTHAAVTRADMTFCGGIM